jgi:hypothetical protein
MLGLPLTGGRKTKMRLRSLFQRKAVRTAPVRPAPAAVTGQDQSRSPDDQQELRDAWAELTEAARHSKVTKFHAWTRTGRHWTEDPAAVRSVAATLREFPSAGGRQTS